jgi:hypothetical protein
VNDALFGITKVVEGDQPAAETVSATKNEKSLILLDSLAVTPVLPTNLPTNA